MSNGAFLADDPEVCYADRKPKQADGVSEEAPVIGLVRKADPTRLEAQKKRTALKATRNKKRRELFDAQDRIDKQRDVLIGKIEQQLKQRQSVETFS